MKSSIAEEETINSPRARTHVIEHLDFDSMIFCNLFILITIASLLTIGISIHSGEYKICRTDQIAIKSHKLMFALWALIIWNR